MTAKIKFENNTLYLSGEVNANNAESIFKQGLQQIQSQPTWPLAIDLAEVVNGRTVLFAVLVQWMRSAPKLDCLKFESIPTMMQKIIKASNLESHFGLIN